MGGILISYLVGEIPGPLPLVTARNWSAIIKKNSILQGCKWWVRLQDNF